MPAEKRTQSLDRILRAARTLFLERTYADVTMAAIATGSQLTKGALYHHFESKEALYLALLYTDLRRKQELFAAAADSAGTCRERLARLTEAFLRLSRAERELIQLVRRDANVLAPAQRAALVRAYQEALPRQVERILEDGVRDGELAPLDCRLGAWHFVAMVEVTLTEYAESTLGKLEGKLEHVLNLFFHGAAGRGPDSA